MLEDDNLHNHDHNGEHAGDGQMHDAEFDEAPLDAANQSLADALRASFWLLKGVMAIVLVLFLASGVFMVDEKQVAVHSRFGAMTGAPKRPGLHFGLPYPIDEVTRVSTAPKTIEVEDFWLKLNQDQKTRSLDELSPRAKGLDPALDGALLTADKAIMHASFRVQYKVPEARANDYATHVGDEEREQRLLRSVIKQAAVAEAARTTADVLLRDPGQLAAAVKSRAQSLLDELASGIQLENVAAPQSYYPLQTKEEFLAVSEAENRKWALTNDANAERENELNGVAGTAWKKIHAEIAKFDQVKDEEERQQIFRNISEMLLEEAMGEAGGKLKLAQRDRERIIDQTLADVYEFNALREEYKRNPDLLRLRLSQAMRDKLFGQIGVTKWVLPPDDKNIVLWLAKDPKEIADETRRRMEEAAKRK